MSCKPSPYQLYGSAENAVGSQDNSVGTETSSKAEVLFPTESRDVLFSTTSTPALELFQLPVHWVLDLFRASIQPEHQVEHLPPSSAEVKRGGAIPPIPQTPSCHNT